MATTTNSNIRLLANLVDPSDEEESEYRFLVDEEYVKYVTIDAGVLPKDDRTFAPVLIPMLPPFPLDPLTQRRADRPSRAKEAGSSAANTCPALDFPVLVKFAEFPWQMPYFEAETTAYEWIEGKGIGPRFLGHLTEAGRVFGFVMENIDGARTAEPQDLATYQRILAKLHALGIKHGDINKHNFLIRNGEAVLIDFETAQKCSEKAELELE
ncbi:hypothetical protein F5Y12DRAFT_797930 [Xylaria sp. FL1777]|nr:hypothetical protein F5Y12DRAFT_797930 [Xylaria sp. FL1777]